MPGGSKHIKEYPSLHDLLMVPIWGLQYFVVDWKSFDAMYARPDFYCTPSPNIRVSTKYKKQARFASSRSI